MFYSHLSLACKIGSYFCLVNVQGRGRHSNHRNVFRRQAGFFFYKSHYSDPLVHQVYFICLVSDQGLLVVPLSRILTTCSFTLATVGGMRLAFFFLLFRTELFSEPLFLRPVRIGKQPHCTLSINVIFCIVCKIFFVARLAWEESRTQNPRVQGRVIDSVLSKTRSFDRTSINLGRLSSVQL